MVNFLQVGKTHINPKMVSAIRKKEVAGERWVLEVYMDGGQMAEETYISEEERDNAFSVVLAAAQIY